MSMFFSPAQTRALERIDKVISDTGYGCPNDAMSTAADIMADLQLYCFRERLDFDDVCAAGRRNIEYDARR